MACYRDSCTFSNATILNRFDVFSLVEVWLSAEFWIGYWIRHINTQFVITLIFTLHQSLQHMLRSFPDWSVFTRRLLVTVSNNGYSSLSVLKSSLNGGSFLTTYSCSSCPPYNPSVRTTIENPVSNSSSIVARELLPRERLYTL
jgi:hypothetical protein